MALDADESWIYFRVDKEKAAQHLAPGTKIENPFGPRNMGPAGIRMKPSGLAVINLLTNEMQIAGQAPKGRSFWHVTGLFQARDPFFPYHLSEGYRPA